MSELVVVGFKKNKYRATDVLVDAKRWKEDFGIDSNFVKDVGALIQPGDSAIFALIESSNPAVAQAAKLENYLRDRSAA